MRARRRVTCAESRSQEWEGDSFLGSRDAAQNRYLELWTDRSKPVSDLPAMRQFMVNDPSTFERSNGRAVLRSRSSAETSPATGARHVRSVVLIPATSGCIGSRWMAAFGHGMDAVYTLRRECSLKAARVNTAKTSHSRGKYSLPSPRATAGRRSFARGSDVEHFDCSESRSRCRQRNEERVSRGGPHSLDCSEQMRGRSPHSLQR